MTDRIVLHKVEGMQSVVVGSVPFHLKTPSQMTLCTVSLFHPRSRGLEGCGWLLGSCAARQEQQRSDANLTLTGTNHDGE
jgi:hypothetical protein